MTEIKPASHVRRTDHEIDYHTQPRRNFSVTATHLQQLHAHRDGQVKDPSHLPIRAVHRGQSDTRNLAVRPHSPVSGGESEFTAAETKRVVPASAHIGLASAWLLILLSVSLSAHAQDQLFNWSEVSVGHFYINTPAVGDLNGDGQLDAVVSASGCDAQACNVASTAIVMAVSHDLAPLPGWPVQTNQVGSLLPPTPPIVTDLDADGRAEVLVGHAQNFYVLTGDGQLLWQQTVDEFFRKRAAVADVDGDGHPEIVAPADQYLGQAKIYVWRADGEPFPGSPLALDEFYASPPAIHGQSGRTLLAVGGGNGFTQSGGKLYLFAFDAAEPLLRLQWQQPVGPHPITPPAFADLDGDGQPEILGGAYTPSVYAVRAADGRRVEGWPQPVGNGLLAAPTILDYDGQKWIFALALDGSLYAWNHQGQQQWMLPTAPNSIEHITVADVDRDGQPELLLGVHGGVLAVDLQGHVIRQWRVGDSWLTTALAAEFVPGQTMVIFGRVDNVTEQARLSLFQM